MSAEIRGMRELRARLDKIPGNAKQGVQREVVRSAVNVQNGAKRRAPVATGRMRNSITHEMDADGMGATVGTNVEYAPHVEFGTSRQRAQPFLFPALEEERARFLAALRRLEL